MEPEKSIEDKEPIKEPKFSKSENSKNPFPDKQEASPEMGSYSLRLYDTWNLSNVKGEEPEYSNPPTTFKIENPLNIEIFKHNRKPIRICAICHRMFIDSTNLKYHQKLEKHNFKPKSFEVGKPFRFEKAKEEI
jgi:hypothetical protein